MAWQIHLEPEVRDWLHGLRATDRGTLKDISAAIEILAERGPALGRPLVDTIQNSALANLKELRPGSAGSSEVRILLAFDEKRQAILLVAGDKAGNWRRWYQGAIPLAELRFKRHQDAMAAAEKQNKE